jgi:hypothetical protein
MRRRRWEPSIYRSTMASLRRSSSYHEYVPDGFLKGIADEKADVSHSGSSGRPHLAANSARSDVSPFFGIPGMSSNGPVPESKDRLDIELR